jgi:hypothetical protein
VIFLLYGAQRTGGFVPVSPRYLAISIFGFFSLGIIAIGASISEFVK